MDIGYKRENYAPLIIKREGKDIKKNWDVKKKKMKREKKGAIFAVAIAVMLLMTMTMVIAAAESHAGKVELAPSEPMTFPTREIPHELIYDDGSAEKAYAWYQGCNKFAVRFTPPSYPVDLDTARVCLWPEWPDGNHEQFAIEVYDDDGPGGAPGTRLGGPVYYTATDWGWNDIDISGLSITINSGDFYIAYHQLTDSPDCEGLCTDTDAPIYGRSWAYFAGEWTPWPDENYMIRCVVDLPAEGKEWTFMVYLDGDNNLEGAGIDDFLEMSSVGSTSDVNIVVQFDRIPGYSSAYDDWTTCKRFLVTPGMTPTAANATEDIGECNMGDLDTLRAFVDWAMAEYPADNYALILWDHGSGWKKWVPWEDEMGIARGICYDDTSGSDYLTLQETEQALIGKYIDLLGYDACLMHMIEVVYQVRTHAAISVGSEEYEPGDGWPYNTILGDLTGTPTMTPSTLGDKIVSRYIASYAPAGDETQSAVDKAKVSNLASAVDNLAQVLIDKLPDDYDKIQQARNGAEEFYYPDYIDLYHFAELIKSYLHDNPEAVNAAQAVMDNVDNTVIAEAHGSSHPNAHGLSIYFPKEESEYLSSYAGTDFAMDTQWDEFLRKYYKGPCGHIVVSIEDTSAPPGGTVTVPINIADVENMCGANIWLNYNKNVVIVDSVSDGDIVPLTYSIDNTAGVTKMVWDTTSGMTGDFVFAYVTLKAVGNPGDTCLLDLDVKELYDCNLVEIPRTVADGTFTIPPKVPDLVITEKWVCWPDNCTICYNVTNIGEGTASACHNTALYVNDVAVAHDYVPVDLAPGESYTGCFDGYEWGYTPPSDNITVCADNNETLEELDETNNCLTNIWMCGDVNCDGKVTMSDVRKVFNRYLDPNYPLVLSWAADVNCDGKVTMSDVRKVFNRYLDPGYGLNCC